MTIESRTWSARHPLRTALAAVGVAVGVSVGAVALPTPAGADDGQAAHLLALLNGERAGRGLAPLRLEATLDAGARRHAEQMGARDQLFHTRMVDDAPAGWVRLAENVGRAGDAPALHAALMASPSHRANVLEPSFDYVGIGVARRGSTSFASFKFADHPATTLAVAAKAAPARSVTADGRVSAVGGASFHGDLSGIALAGPVVGLVPTRSGSGYWLVAADGGVFAFGDAAFHGSAGGRALPSPIVRMNRTFDDRGYALYAADGGRYGFGSAHR